MKTLSTLAIMLGISACSSVGSRQFLDSSTGRDEAPRWAKTTKISWPEDNVIKLKALYVARGDERIGGCFDIAKLDLKENIMSEMAMDLRGQIEGATTSISEDAENFLSKVRSGSFQGRISGLKTSEEYFERYKVGETERINCYVLGEITRADYEKLKLQIMRKVVDIDSSLKNALIDSQVNFVKGKNQPSPNLTSNE